MKVIAASLRRQDHAIKLVSTLLFNNTNKTTSYIIVNNKCCNISTNVTSNISLVVNQQQNISRLQCHGFKFTSASSTTTSTTTYKSFSLDYLNSLLDNKKKKENKTCLGKSKKNFYFILQSVRGKFLSFGIFLLLYKILSL
jgi:hypothetical protein